MVMRRVPNDDLERRAVLSPGEKPADFPLEFGGQPLPAIRIRIHPEIQAAMLSNRHDDAGINLEGGSEPFPIPVDRCVDAVAVLPVPMVVEWRSARFKPPSR